MAGEMREESRARLCALADEYRRSGRALMERKGQLQRALHGARGCQQRLNLRRRMAVLDQMAAETFRTAAYLAHYYDEGKGGSGACPRSA